MEGEQKFLDIHSIEVDVNNPRIKRLIEKLVESLAEGEELTENRILLALEFSPTNDESTDKTDSAMTFTKLRNSIIQNKGILQPIIVKKIEGQRYKCIEGNTRLAIYKQQNKKKPEEEWWEKIKSTVYDEITEDEENRIRLQCHLVPPRQWEPYSRAKFLHKLINEDNNDEDTIAGVCGVPTSEIRNYLDAYRMMEDDYKTYCDEIGDEMDVKRFSGFLELTTRPSLQSTIIQNGFTFRDFSIWLHNRDKIKELRHVRSLERILRNPQAKEIFLNEGSKSALNVFVNDVAGNLQNADVLTLLNATIAKLNNTPYPQMRALFQDSSLLEDCGILIDICQGYLEDNV